MLKKIRSDRRRYLIITGIICAAVLSLGNFDNPPNGFTGAPGESLCTECHTLGTATQNGSIIFSGFPATINANQTYVLTITVVNPNGVANYAGFQTVILDENEENAGSLSNPSLGSVITQFGDRTYHEHNPAQAFPAANAVAWTVNWTAPVGSGQVSYYAAANIANGNNDDTGDRIVTRTGTGTLFTPVQLQITDIDHVSCFDGSDGSLMAVASFGSPGYTYAWSHGASGQLVVGLSSGSYTVTVTDSQGATATASAQVNEPPLFQIISESVDHISCQGEDDGLIILELEGGVPPYTGAQGNFITYANLPPGEFVVQITDANGCLITEEFFINEPVELNVELVTSIEPDCFGEASGFIIIEGSGGTGDYEFEWSNSGTMNTIQNIESGIYSVTITDENGCTAAQTYILDEPEVLELDLIATMAVTCNGNADGALTVLGNGGTGDLEYEWSNGLVSNAINGLLATDYSVTVSDENGCSDVATYVVTEPEPLDVYFVGLLNLACFDDDNGLIIAQPSGGTVSYSFLWENGSTNAVLEGLLAGIYDVTVTDANGCTSVSSAEITEPPPLIPNVTSTGESAVGAMDGTATASPEGGTGDYTFLWNTGATTPAITGLAAGVFSVTVTDENGCTATQSVAVTGINCALMINTLSTPAMCYEGASGSVEVIVNGAIGVVDILWSTGDTSMAVSDLSAGIYTVAITDDVGCIAVAEVEVGEPDALYSIMSVISETMEGANNGNISSLIWGGTMPYEFLWSNGDTTEHLDGLAPGLYTLTVTDGNGCMLVDTAFVNAFMCGLQLILATEAPMCFGENSGSASAQVLGGASPYEFLWSNGDTTSMIDSLSAGMYAVTITDADGCVAEQSTIISQPDPITVLVDTIVLATQSTGGSIHITISGGTGPYTTIWTKDGGLISTEEDPIDLVAGEYELLILDANDCRLDSLEVTVTFSSGVRDFYEDLDLKIWPNPAGDFIRISVDGIHEPLHCAIYSSTGILIRRIANLNAEEMHLEVSDLARGLYYVQISNDRKERMMAFVKM